MSVWRILQRCYDIVHGTSYYYYQTLLYYARILHAHLILPTIIIIKRVLCARFPRVRRRHQSTSRYRGRCRCAVCTARNYAIFCVRRAWSPTPRSRGLAQYSRVPGTLRAGVIILFRTSRKLSGAGGPVAPNNGILLHTFRKCPRLSRIAVGVNVWNTIVSTDLGNTEILGRITWLELFWNLYDKPVNRCTHSREHFNIFIISVCTWTV